MHARVADPPASDGSFYWALLWGLRPDCKLSEANFSSLALILCGEHCRNGSFDRSHLESCASVVRAKFGYGSLTIS